MEPQYPAILIFTLLSLHLVAVASVPYNPAKAGFDSPITSRIDGSQVKGILKDRLSRQKRQLDSLGGALIPGFVRKKCLNKYQCLLENMRDAQSKKLDEGDMDSRLIILPDSYYNHWAKRIIREAKFDRIEQPTGLDF